MIDLLEIILIEPQVLSIRVTDSPQSTFARHIGNLVLLEASYRTNILNQTAARSAAYIFRKANPKEKLLTGLARQLFGIVVVTRTGAPRCNPYTAIELLA